MASRRLMDLSPAMQDMVNEFLARCADDPWMERNGITVLITCTYRSGVEQNALYAQGCTAPGRIVTRARGGQSWHNAVDPRTHAPAAEALDFVPLRHGKPVWGVSGDGIDDDPGDDYRDDLEAWDRIGAHGKAAGMQWYGDPDASFHEKPHLQNPHPTMARAA